MRLARVTAKAALGNIDSAALGHLFLGRLVVKGHCLALLDRQGPGWADTQAEAGPIAQLLPHNAGLAIHEFNRALGTGRYA
jgi:hypothetical protein